MEPNRAFRNKKLGIKHESLIYQCMHCGWRHIVLSGGFFHHICTHCGYEGSKFKITPRR